MKRALGVLLTILALATFYEWLVVEAIPAEAVAAVCIAITGLFAAIRTQRTRLVEGAVSLDFLKPCFVRVMPAIFRESFDVLVPVLWRATILRRPIAGRWIALRYDGRDDSEAREYARRTIVIFGSNLTPNALPLDVDADHGRLTLHQLVPRRESAAADPRYPM